MTWSGLRDLGRCPPMSGSPSMKLISAVTLGIFTSVPTPALACLPPPPGVAEPPPPTTEEKAKQIYGWSTDIVYGVVVSDINDDETRFRILHVYKGTLKQGQVIEPMLSWGFDAPACAGLMGAPPSFPGQYGVIGFFQRPELNFIPDDHLKIMFDAKWIISAQQR